MKINVNNSVRKIDEETLNKIYSIESRIEKRYKIIENSTKATVTENTKSACLIGTPLIISVASFLTLIYDFANHGTQIMSGDIPKSFFISSCIFVTSLITSAKVSNLEAKKNEEINKTKKEKLVELNRALRILQNFKSNPNSESFNYIKEFLNTIDLYEIKNDLNLIDNFLKTIHQNKKNINSIKNVKEENNFINREYITQYQKIRRI